MIGGNGPVGETYFWNVAGISGVLLPTAIMMGSSCWPSAVGHCRSGA
jgi:hypothetical protein